MANFRNVVSLAVRAAFLFAAWSGPTPVSIEAAQSGTLSPQQSVGFERGLGVNVNLFGEIHSGDTVHTFLSDLGVGLVRFDLNKPEIDGSHGWAHIDSTVAIIKREGGVPLAILTALTTVDSATFRDFVRDAIDRVGQDVDYFEIWNEPDAEDRPISGSLYDQLAEVAIDELHDAGKIAVGPAMGGANASDMKSYIEDRLAANPGFDVVSFHSYGLNSDTRQRADSIGDIAGGRPLWITEIGPPSGTWDEQESNSLLEGLIYEMDLMNVDQFVWWHLFSDGDQATSFAESDLLEVTASLVFQGKTSLFYTFQGAVSNKTVTEYTRWIPPGSAAEGQLRTRQVIGQESTTGYLLRTASVLSPPLDPMEESSGRGVGWRFEVLPQELHTVWNSDLPFSMNDGALWAGRGVNTLLRAGFRATYRGLHVVFAPEVTHSQNRAFPIFEGADPERSRFSSPWYVGRNSADLPLRFGDQSLNAFNLGQSSVTLAYRSVSGGLSNESMWWGPGVRNALVLSNHAQGIPHVFLRTSRPVSTPLGMLEGRMIVGTLTESLFFDRVLANDRRSASGAVITLAMPFDPNLTIGMERMVVRPMKKVRSLAGRAVDFAVRWDRLKGTPRSDHLTAVFGRWIFPESGFEMYVEWSRTEIPGSLRKWLTTPHHTQGYTFGLQWVRQDETEDSYLRTQLELTGLDQNRVRFEGPEPPDYYTGRAAPQGLTQRGQVLGAAIGPGGSSQWLAIDYFRDRWSAGGFLARTRWDNDALFRQRHANFFKHDFSLMTGVRGSFTLGDVEVHGEWTLAKRFNYLFQQGRFNPGGFRTVDIWNNTLDLYVTSHWLGGGE